MIVVKKCTMPNVQTDAFPQKIILISLVDMMIVVIKFFIYRGYRNDRDHLDYHDNPMCRLMYSLKNYHNYPGCHDDCGYKFFHDYRGYRNDRDHLDNHDNLIAGLPNVQTDAFPEKIS